MRLIVRILLVVLVLTCGKAFAQGGGFLSVYDDLPLPPAVKEDPGTAVSFDTPAGRLVEAYAHGQTTAHAVRSFYGEALPQLGWASVPNPPKKETLRWKRDNETLDIMVNQRGDNVVLWFSVTPE